MPSELKKEDIEQKNDPSVARQWDDETPKDQQFKDFYDIADGLKICLFSTYRPSIGPVSRAMAVAKRTGPDFLFLANNHSQKFDDLKANPEVNISFHDKTSQNWISVTGTATTTSNSDSRIKQVWSKMAAAWFGDLGDGVHDASPDDPRMTLIEVKPKCEFFRSFSLPRLVVKC